MLIFDNFLPNLSLRTIVSFFTQSFETVVSFFTDHLFPDRCFIFHPIICFQTFGSFFTQNLEAARIELPDLIHDELEHRTTVSCFICFKFVLISAQNIGRIPGLTTYQVEPLGDIYVTSVK